jgi:hypothetical protein
MADKKISALTGASTPLAGTEVIPIVQSGSTVKVATNDLTVRNIRANATTGILQVTGPTAATTRVVTVPDANFTAARTDAAQTFTGNQTFSGTVQAAIVNAISGTGDVFLINAKTDDATAANNAGVGLRANSSATAANRFAQLWFDADGANLSGGDYFIITKSGSDGPADIINYSPAVMRFAANYIGRAAIDLTIETTGNVTVNNGNLVIGTSGKGIDFSADGQAAGMTSELLADYEEGTWTPAYIGTTTNPTVSYTSQTGRYTKVGRIVSVTGFIQATPSLGGVGSLQISGLPYTSANVTEYPGSVGYSSQFTATGAPISIAVGQNATVMNLYKTASADARSGTYASVSAATDINLSGGYFYFSATYIV